MLDYVVVEYDERMLLDAAELIDRITKYREEVWHDALAMYCQGHERFDTWEPTQTVRAWGQEVTIPGKTWGYEAACLASTEELQAIFEEDDWGDLWERLDGELRECWENDAGRMQACNDILRMLGVETNEGGLL